MMHDLRKQKLDPLEGRVWKIKNPSMEFFCPLCRTQRAFTSKPQLSIANYIQIVAISVTLMVFFWPLMGVRGSIAFFIVWTLFEIGKRVLFRKEIPCPYCGFDASWYKRDVKKAKQLVLEFWEEKKKSTKEDVESVDAQGEEHIDSFVQD